MRFFKLLTLAAATGALAAPANPAAVSLINSTIAPAKAADCPSPTRYACGQYMLEDGTRQDFESQVYKCIPSDDFICQTFAYAPFNPTHPGEPGHMIGAKVDPGCTCTFYTVACDGSQYTEKWVGWESKPNSPPWNRVAWTDKRFTGWWCEEFY